MTTSYIDEINGLETVPETFRDEVNKRMKKNPPCFNLQTKEWPYKCGKKNGSVEIGDIRSYCISENMSKCPELNPLFIIFKQV